MSFLKETAEILGLNLSDEQIQNFEIYKNFLLEYNEHVNLTSITKSKEIDIKHFLDSVALLKFIKISNNCKLADIGTGAGFPGVPLAILNKSVKLTLIDSLQKRVEFLKKLSQKLNLKADVFHGRAEDLAKSVDFREKFDLVVSRAVASLSVLAEYCLPYVKKEGLFVAFKGPDIENEITNSENTIKILGGKIINTYQFELPFGNGGRNLIIIQKIKDTPKTYPRSNSQIKNNKL